MKISACWIAKNEEHNLARSMQSVAAVADELVVVDTGSADRTADIAAANGARVEHFSWNDDFSAARNFALQKVGGDIVIFIDADEWFSPPLGEKQRKNIERLFKGSADVAIVTRKNVSLDEAQVVSVDTVGRILRGGGTLRYAGRIHEEPRRADGRANSLGDLTNLTLLHNGYAGPLMPDKAARNLALLKLEWETSTGDEKSTAAFYLMRESSSAGQAEESLGYLHYFLEDPARATGWMRRFPLYAPLLMTHALAIALAAPRALDAGAFHRGIIEPTIAACRDHPVVCLAEEYFALCFDYSEAGLLRRLPEALARAEKVKKATAEANHLEYPAVASLLCAKAATAALHRGNAPLAQEWASRSIECDRDNPRPEALSALLRAIKDQPSAEVTALLQKQLDTARPKTLLALLRALLCNGFAVPYGGFVIRLMELGKAPRNEFWYALILLGSPEQSAATVLKEKDAHPAEEVRQALFYAAASAPDTALFEQCKGHLGEYAAVLQAAFGAGELSPPPDRATFAEHYARIAFAGGLDAANRYLNVYGADAPLCFSVACEYYKKSGYYAEFLRDNDHTPPLEDADNRLRLADMHVLAGQYAEAKALLEGWPEDKRADTGYRNLWELLEEKGGGN